MKRIKPEPTTTDGDPHLNRSSRSPQTLGNVRRFYQPWLISFSAAKIVIYFTSIIVVLAIDYQRSSLIGTYKVSNSSAIPYTINKNAFLVKATSISQSSSGSISPFRPRPFVLNKIAASLASPSVSSPRPPPSPLPLEAPIVTSTRNILNNDNYNFFISPANEQQQPQKFINKRPISKKGSYLIHTTSGGLNSKDETQSQRGFDEDEDGDTGHHEKTSGHFVFNTTATNKPKKNGQHSKRNIKLDDLDEDSPMTRRSQSSRTIESIIPSVAQQTTDLTTISSTATTASTNNNQINKIAINNDKNDQSMDNLLASSSDVLHSRRNKKSSYSQPKSTIFRSAIGTQRDRNSTSRPMANLHSNGLDSGSDPSLTDSLDFNQLFTTLNSQDATNTNGRIAQTQKFRRPAYMSSVKSDRTTTMADNSDVSTSSADGSSSGESNYDQGETSSEFSPAGHSNQDNSRPSNDQSEGKGQRHNQQHVANEADYVGSPSSSDSGDNKIQSLLSDIQHDDKLSNSSFDYLTTPLSVMFPSSNSPNKQSVGSDTHSFLSSAPQVGEKDPDAILSSANNGPNDDQAKVSFDSLGNDDSHSSPSSGSGSQMFSEGQQQVDQHQKSTSASPSSYFSSGSSTLATTESSPILDIGTETGGDGSSESELETPPYGNLTASGSLRYTTAAPHYQRESPNQTTTATNNFYNNNNDDPGNNSEGRIKSNSFIGGNNTTGPTISTSWRTGRLGMQTRSPLSMRGSKYNNLQTRSSTSSPAIYFRDSITGEGGTTANNNEGQTNNRSNRLLISQGAGGNAADRRTNTNRLTTMATTKQRGSNHHRNTPARSDTSGGTYKDSGVTFSGANEPDSMGPIDNLNSGGSGGAGYPDNSGSLGGSTGGQFSSQAGGATITTTRSIYRPIYRYSPASSFANYPVSTGAYYSSPTSGQYLAPHYSTGYHHGVQVAPSASVQHYYGQPSNLATYAVAASPLHHQNHHNHNNGGANGYHHHYQLATVNGGLSNGGLLSSYYPAASSLWANGYPATATTNLGSSHRIGRLVSIGTGGSRSVGSGHHFDDHLNGATGNVGLNSANGATSINSSPHHMAAAPSTNPSTSTDPMWSDTQNQEDDYQQAPQTIQITAVPNGFGNGLVGNGFVGAGPLGWNNVNGFNGRQVLLINRPPFGPFAGQPIIQAGAAASGSGFDWRLLLIPVVVVLAMPLILGALLVPVFLKSVMFLIQILQALGLLMPASQLVQQIAHSNHSHG